MTRRVSDLRTADLGEYDAAADWCAARGLKGTNGDPLPTNLSDAVRDAICDDPEAFEARVRECAYARAMSQIRREE